SLSGRIRAVASLGVAFLRGVFPLRDHEASQIVYAPKPTPQLHVLASLSDSATPNAYGVEEIVKSQVLIALQAILLGGADGGLQRNISCLFIQSQDGLDFVRINFPVLEPAGKSEIARPVLVNSRPNGQKLRLWCIATVRKEDDHTRLVSRA